MHLQQVLHFADTESCSHCDGAVLMQRRYIAANLASIVELTAWSVPLISKLLDDVTTVTHAVCQHFIAATSRICICTCTKMRC
jgi:hypothetical protein